MTVDLEAAATSLHQAWEALKPRAVTNQPLEDALTVVRERLHGVLVDVDALAAQHGQ